MFDALLVILNALIDFVALRTALLTAYETRVKFLPVKLIVVFAV